MKEEGICVPIRFPAWCFREQVNGIIWSFVYSQLRIKVHRQVAAIPAIAGGSWTTPFSVTLPLEPSEEIPSDT